MWRCPQHENTTTNCFRVLVLIGRHGHCVVAVEDNATSRNSTLCIRTESVNIKQASPTLGPTQDNLRHYSTSVTLQPNSHPNHCPAVNHCKVVFSLLDRGFVGLGQRVEEAEHSHGVYFKSRKSQGTLVNCHSYLHRRQQNCPYEESIWAPPCTIVEPRYLANLSTCICLKTGFIEVFPLFPLLLP